MQNPKKKHTYFSKKASVNW